MDFPELDRNLNKWAEFMPDSPAASRIKNTLDQVLGDTKLHNAQRADLLCLLSAVYQGGCEAGHVSGRLQGAQDYAQTQPKPPQALRVHDVWTTVDEYGRHGEQIGLFLDVKDAETAAEGRGWFGGKGSVIDYPAIRYDGVVYVLRDQIDVANIGVDLPKLREQKKAAALAKLTAEDKKLLGIRE